MTHLVRPGPVLGLLFLAATASLEAQTIRGTVVDDNAKLPVPEVVITLLDDIGAEIQRGMRTTPRDAR